MMAAFFPIKLPFLSILGDGCKNTHKRIHYVIPTYKKSDKIIKNIKRYKSNQKHVFRYRALQKAYEEIAREIYSGQLKLNVGELSLFKNGFIIHFGEEEPHQAEIDGTQNLPVGQRLKIHIRLLRFLRQGYKVNVSLRTVKRKYKNIILTKVDKDAKAKARKIL